MFLGRPAGVLGDKEKGEEPQQGVCLRDTMGPALPYLDELRGMGRR